MILKKFNEFGSESYREAKEIVNTLYVVCDELTDEGIEWRISPERDNDILIKIIGLRINSLWESGIPVFFVEIEIMNLNKSKKEKVKEVLTSLEGYSKSMGLEFFYHYYGSNSGKCSGFDESVLDRDFNKLRFYLNI